MIRWNDRSVIDRLVNVIENIEKGFAREGEKQRKPQST